MTTPKQSPQPPRLMTWEEYNRGEWEWPYIVTLEKNGNVLDYFGEAHSFDPNDEQWEKARVLWAGFLKKTEGRKRIAFVEGGVREPSVSVEESIKRDGGMGLVTYVAHEAGIETYSPEPDEALERAELEKHFSRDEIQCYYFARVVHQWSRLPEPRPDFETYMTPFLRGDERRSGWKDYDFSLSHMRQIHEQLMGVPFDSEDEDIFEKAADPMRKNEGVNGVARGSSDFRDAHIVKEILRYMADGYSIFAQYGGSHVVMQEPLLRALLKS